MKKLLIIDIQKGFINENNADLIEKIENLIKNEKFDKVYATQFKNFSKSQYGSWLNWTALKSKTEQKLPKTIEKSVDAIIEKTSYALPDDQLKKYFRKDDEVYLCGTDYDACVLAVAFQLFDNEIRPYIILDCVGSHSNLPISKKSFEKMCIKNFGKNSIIKNKKGC